MFRVSVMDIVEACSIALTAMQTTPLSHLTIQHAALVPVIRSLLAASLLW